jgi:hypothetical protein
MTAPIINNKNFGYGRNLANKFDENFFEPIRNDGNITIIQNITWEHLGGIIMGNQEFVSNLLWCRIPLDLYNKLKLGHEIAFKKYYKKGETTITTKNWLKKIGVKGKSKRYRIVMAKSEPDPDPLTLRQLITFRRVLGLGNITRQIAKQWMGMWAKNFLPTEIRTFCYNYYNNTLPVNARISHFIENIVPECTFCILAKNLPAEKETLSHLFYYCPTSFKIIRGICEEFLTEPHNLNPELLETGKNLILQLFFDIARYLLWEKKLLKKIPVKENIIGRIKMYLYIAAKCSQKISDKLTDGTVLTLILTAGWPKDPLLKKLK